MQVLKGKLDIVLKEELVRVKLQLEQSQYLRINEIKKRSSGQSTRANNTPNITVEKQFIDENTHLLANITELKQNLENESKKNVSQSEQIKELQKKLHAYELDQSLCRSNSFKNSNTNLLKAATTNPRKDFMLTMSSSTESIKNEALYFEILEELHTQGVDKNASYQEIVIALYQRSSGTKQMHDLLYYMNKLNMHDTNEPAKLLKDLYEQLEVQKREIAFLNAKNDTLKLEINYQQREYAKQMQDLLKETENDFKLNSYQGPTSKTTTFVCPSPHTGRKIDGYRYKVIYNINSRLEGENRNANPTESVSDTNQKKNFSSSLKVTTSKSYQITTEEANGNTMNDDNQNDMQVKQLEDQIASLRAELTNTNKKVEITQAESENVQYLTEQVKQLEEEIKQVKHEKFQQAKILENFIAQIKEEKKLLKIEHQEQIRQLEDQHKKEANEKSEKIKTFEADVQRRKQDQMDKTKTLEEEIKKIKLEHNEQIKKIEDDNKRIKQEQSDYKQKNKAKSLQYKLKIEEYQTEINEVNQELNKYQVDVERLKMELTLRADEMKKLQMESKDFSEYKLKYNQLEEKLLVEIKNNQVLQSKIDQSQQEMFSLLKIANNNKNDDATLSGDRIIELLKEIIKEQMSAKPTSSPHEVEEYKLKINELQTKISHEKLMKESLEIKLKLIEQDNQNLRQTLLSNNRKFVNNEKMSKSRMDEINELIERAQINAKTMMASNPSLSNLIETR